MGRDRAGADERVVADCAAGSPLVVRGARGPQKRQSRVPSAVRLTGFPAVWLLPERLLLWQAAPRSDVALSDRPASTVTTVVSSAASPPVPASIALSWRAPPSRLASPEPASIPASPPAVNADSVRRAITCRPANRRAVVVPLLIRTLAL